MWRTAEGFGKGSSKTVFKKQGCKVWGKACRWGLGESQAISAFNKEIKLLWHTSFVAETTVWKAGMALPRSGYL